MKAGIIFALITAGFVIYDLRENNHKHRKIVVSETLENFCGVQSDSKDASMNKVPIVFKAKCAACHFKYKDATGPALILVELRLPDTSYFEKFVRSQQKLLNEKDEYAVKITASRVADFEHGFSEITPEQMKELRKYLRTI